MNLKIILIISTFLISLESLAQDLTFRQITSEDGISQSEVYCFLQDSRGYMWIGSLYGLNRYDGYTIETFNMSEEDPNGLIHNTINCLAEDKFGRIWIGTSEGMNVYDPVSERMLKMPDFYSGKQINIVDLFADDRNLWIGTSRGLFRMSIPVKQMDELRLQNISQKIRYVELEINGATILNTYVWKVLKSYDGQIWIGTRDGLGSFNYDTDQPEHYLFHEISGELSNVNSILSLAEDRNNNIWIGTRKQGLYRYNRSSGGVSLFLADRSQPNSFGNIKSIVTDKQGNLWAGSITGGVVRIEADQLLEDVPRMQLIRNNEFHVGSINSSMIRSLYVSEEGIVWIGTIGSGINLYSPNENRFNLHRIPPDEKTGERNNFIRAICPVEEKIVWLGLHNSGLYKYDEAIDRFTHMGPEKGYTVFDIQPVDKNHIWMATGTGARLVRTYETEVDIVNTLDPAAKEDLPAYSACFNIEKCTESVFYIGSITGIIRAELDENYRIQSTSYNVYSDFSIPTRNVRVLHYDPDANVLWAGSEGFGLSQIFLDENLYPDSIQNYLHIHGDTTSLSSDYIRSLCFDRDRNLWIGTYDGLNRAILQEATGSYVFRSWKIDDGLPNNMIQSIEEDSEGNLWIGTNGGLSKYVRDDERFFNYRISDGLQSNEFSEHTSFFSENGKMYFGGINGFNVFDPRQIASSPAFPAVNITGFYLRNQPVKAGEEVKSHMLLERSIDYTDSIILRPGENDLRFDFSAMYYTNPQKINYMYKLEGYDQDWVVTDAMERNANYTNLPYGKYEFKVKASNSKDLWNDASTSLFIQIKTPYALRWWAFAIYLLIFVLGVLYFTRYSIIKITTKRKLVLDNEHNQRLHELDVMRTRFFINISHDLRTPLTLISGPVDSILKNFSLSTELRSHIDLVKKSTKRLRYLIEQLLDTRKVETGKLNPCPSPVNIVEFIRTESEYFHLEMKRKGIRFKIESSVPVIEAWVDPDMMGKVVFNLLSNAIKFTSDEQIAIKVSEIPKGNSANIPGALQEQDLVKIEFIDHGKGMPEEKTSKIFERFYQDAEHPGSGYGIGLSHTKDLIDAHNGTIQVQSRPGKGTTFTIYLPVLYDFEGNANHESFAQPHPETMHVDHDQEIVQKIAPDGSNDKQCILIVEDNIDLQNYLVSSLVSEYKIQQASDGEEGLNIALQESPDLIVSDINMPNMDGYELCKLVKSNKRTSHIPVILLTARVDDASRYKGLDTGADDYITKPFDTEYLRLRITNILKTREQLRNLFQQNMDLEPSAVTVTSADDKFLRQLMEKIEEGIPEPDFKVDTLEKELGISHTHFYRKVKSLTGCSGKELLQNMRLKRAIDLLGQNKQLRISEIAYMTGFNNPKYFSKCFKERYRVTPSEYTENLNKTGS